MVIGAGEVADNHALGHGEEQGQDAGDLAAETLAEQVHQDETREAERRRCESCGHQAPPEE